MNIEEVFNTIKNMSAFANKELGQNYLINPKISSQIVDLLDIKVNDKILEIGAGFGSLSLFLLDKPFSSLTLNDIDPRAITFLSSLSNENTNVEVINKSALKLDLNKYTKIISNIPYYLTNDLLEYCLTSSNASKMVFMVQKEVLNRVFSTSSDNYGPLSILFSILGTTKKEFFVNHLEFLPSPHIDSAIFSFTRNLNIKINKYAFLQFLKRMFLHRRKTIYNNLSLYLMDKDKAKQILDKLNVSFFVRPEQISPYVFLKMFEDSCY